MNNPRPLFLLTVLAMALSSCTREIGAERQGLTVSISADRTRTAYSDPHITWVEADTMCMNISSSGYGKATISISQDGKATFSRTASITSAGTYHAQGVVPSSAFAAMDSDIDSATGMIDGYALTLSPEQSCTCSTFDPSADILVSDIVDFSVTEAEIASGTKVVGQMFRYTRPFAMAQFSFSNAPEEYADENVSSVTVRFSDYVIAGAARQFDIGSCSFVDKDGKSYDDVSDAFYRDASYKIRITTEDSPKVSDLKVWFMLAPVSADHGTLTLTIDTDRHYITKSVDLSSTPLRFETNRLNTASVSLATTTSSSEKGSGTFALVKSADDLSSGQQVIIAAAAKDYALGVQNTNNRSQESITKSGDGTLRTIGANVAILALGGTKGAWTLYDKTEKGFLYAASSSSNYLRTQATNDANGEWTISIASGKATITANGSNTRKRLFHNSGSKIFSCYVTDASMQDVAIYHMTGSALDKPVISASVDAGLRTATVAWNAVRDARTYTVACTGHSSVSVTDNGAESYSQTFEGLEDGVAYTLSVTANPYDGHTIASTASTVVSFGSSMPYMGCMEMPAVPLKDESPTIDSSAATKGREIIMNVDGSSSRKVVVHEFDDYGSTSGTSCGKWYRNYTMLYDNTKYAALWVAYSLSSWHFPMASSMSRPDSWYTDPAVVQYSGGYKENTKYDRGHQCANMTRNRCSYKAQLQTFFHSNQTPQISSFNQGQWNNLEDKEMQWYQECDTMYVATGPIFDAGYTTTLDKSGTAIPVPTRYFKAFLKCTWKGGNLDTVKGIGFIFPNDTSAPAYTKAVASISDIETETGLSLFTNLPSGFSSARGNTSPEAFTSNW